METTVKEEKENKVITLDQVNVRNLPELQGWKEKQHQIVKEHPFIAIEDYKSYEEAKKHRTALVTARTDIQKQDKLIASKLKELRSEAGKVAAELIEITQPHEDKQQEEVKRYEAEKEAERLEKERIEQERKEKIQKSINTVYESWKAGIKELQFENIEAFKKDMAEALEKKSEEDLEEFEMDLAEKSRLLNDQLAERIDYLQREEANRAERERLEKERREFEAQKAKEAEEKEKQIKARVSLFITKLLENGFEQENTDSEDRIFTKANHSFSESLLRDFSEAAFNERLESINESIKKDAELAELKEAQKKAEQEKFANRKEKLEVLGYKVSHLDQFVNDEYTIVLDHFEDDVLKASNEEFEKILTEAKTKLAEEKAAWEKRQEEEKARKEADEKRKAELQPDREKLFAYINSLSFSSEEPKLKDEAAKDFLIKCQEKLAKLQIELVNEADSIK